jgi:hypothetical protein
LVCADVFQAGVTMAGPVEQALHAVCDEASLLQFIQVLASDFEADRTESAEGGGTPYGPGPRGWENGTVDVFLERAASWAEASRGRFPTSANPWRRCADILYAGKFYE